MTQNLEQYAASQLRAEMARRSPPLPAVGLARLIGRDETWVGRRMRGRSSMTLGDLELVAAALGVPVSYFLPADVAA